MPRPLRQKIRVVRRGVRGTPPARRRNFKPLSVVAFLSDPQLLGSHFAGPSWDAWKCFLRALFAEPMSDTELAIYTGATGRTAAPSQPSREAYAIVSRRGGKSVIASALVTYMACARDWTPHLAPGERAHCALLAADKSQAGQCMAYIKGFLDGSSLLRSLITRRTATTVELRNRVTITVLPASNRLSRGRSFACVVADELAFWRSETSVEPAEEVLRALRPGLATLPGSLLFCISSPYAKSGPLYTAFRDWWGVNDAPALVWRAASTDTNPTLDQAVVRAAIEQDPQASQSEWLGVFRDDVRGYVDPDVVDACIMRDVRELPPLPDVAYTAFCDPAGGSGTDAMTLAIVHREDDTFVVDSVLAFSPPFSPDAVTAEMAAVLKRYGLRKVFSDRYGGSWPSERFQLHGVEVEFSPKPRSDLYVDLLPALNAHRVRLLDDPKLIAELCNLERRTGRSGRDVVDHMRGLRDDRINSVAGAIVLCEAPTDYYVGAANLSTTPRLRGFDIEQGERATYESEWADRQRRDDAELIGLPSIARTY
jgi:hypothetical protein